MTPIWHSYDISSKVFVLLRSFSFINKGITYMRCWCLHGFWCVEDNRMNTCPKVPRRVKFKCLKYLMGAKGLLCTVILMIYIYIYNTIEENNFVTWVQWFIKIVTESCFWRIMGLMFVSMRIINWRIKKKKNSQYWNGGVLEAELVGKDLKIHGLDRGFCWR